MSTRSTLMESARLCADRLYKDPARAVLRAIEGHTTVAQGFHDASETFSLIAVYNSKGHPATPRSITPQQHHFWTREFVQHAYALARETEAALTGELDGFTVQLA
ncbi:hypothetical protein [Streptomyces sp. MZ04]|uniref:hypothetical protein n=1 Tax=Streptomyces sp. MZ04 TaxID=2559236 RepID=UPI00107E6877|nr:hypothetical protein [Streptomyces sp. MZ04]TGB07382.1 hypothetical protein E2651_21745 [Streptomyces sp. MZ04]